MVQKVTTRAADGGDGRTTPVADRDRSREAGMRPPPTEHTALTQTGTLHTTQSTESEATERVNN